MWRPLRWALRSIRYHYETLPHAQDSENIRAHGLHRGVKHGQIDMAAKAPIEDKLFHAISLRLRLRR